MKRQLIRINGSRSVRTIATFPSAKELNSRSFAEAMVTVDAYSVGSHWGREEET